MSKYQTQATNLDNLFSLSAKSERNITRRREKLSKPHRSASVSSSNRVKSARKEHKISPFKFNFGIDFNKMEKTAAHMEGNCFKEVPSWKETKSSMTSSHEGDEESEMSEISMIEYEIDSAGIVTRKDGPCEELSVSSLHKNVQSNKEYFLFLDF